MEKAIKRYWPVFVLPTLIAFIIGFVWPFIWGTGLSFCKFTTVKNVQFVGLSNYKMIWIDDTFTHAFWFTAVFTIVSTVLINVLAFSIALLLTRGMRGTNAFRTIFFLPNLIGGIVLGYIWQILLNGILSALGKPLLALNATYGFWGLIILMCWQQIGYMMIIYIAGLQNVPTDLIEAARIDGATSRQILLEDQGSHGHAQRDDLHLPDADQRLQAVRPEPLSDGWRTGQAVHDAGVQHL